MGFDEQLVVEGLKQTNNNRDATLNLLVSNKHVLEAAASANYRPKDSDVHRLKLKLKLKRSLF